MDSNESSAALGVGLLARLGGRLIGLPLETVGQVAELRVTPIPLARSIVSGIAFHEGQGLVVLRLARSARVAGGAVVAVAIQVAGLSVRCAVEVDSLAGMARLRRAARRDGAPAWWIDSVAEDGRAVGWIDIAALLHATLAAREDLPSPVAA